MPNQDNLLNGWSLLDEEQNAQSFYKSNIAPYYMQVYMILHLQYLAPLNNPQAWQKGNIIDPALSLSLSQLQVSTTDMTGRLMEGPVDLDVFVIDQNDNRPIFRETRYSGEVLEGSPTGMNCSLSLSLPPVLLLFLSPTSTVSACKLFRREVIMMSSPSDEA